VEEDIATGRLVVVLPKIEPAGLFIHAIYPQRNVPVRVRTFLDFLSAWLPRESTWLHADRVRRSCRQADAAAGDCSELPVETVPLAAK
jgi:hypothetical protein